MELDQLRYFLAAARHGSFTRAAGELGLSQPAISRSILKLEEELGQPVFERQPRALVLSDAGRLLHDRARQVLAIVADTKAELRDDGSSGSVRLGAIPTIAPYFLPDVLREFSAEFPEARLVVQEHTTDRLIREVADGEIDLAVLALPVPAGKLAVEELFEEELLLVLPPAHPLAHAARVRPKDVASQKFVLLDEAHCLSGQIRSFCRRRAFQPINVERTMQLAMVQELVSLGHGVSLIPEMARRLDRSERRVYRSLSGDRPSRRVAAMWNPARFRNRLVETFRARLRGHARRGRAR